eukprot:CAMPEP_0204841256 /NCGR_PEP_ID=MMETSP1346-20131115/41348_1 /ASSEMBLY_ACC=CAM_ASM_000771 /TAXON_ID=215587 /ORGANISM="Aplanochytrium stocchinoi, Strain GSBS06" /LENGTH=447 /DNA_ID=CAMNT_0051979279 /DNA_START=156 /DNA_END=1499 /DNA_ORIENTATION=-
MDELEIEEFSKNMPPPGRFFLYYFQNIGMLCELPLHLLYHIILQILFLILLIPFEIFQCCCFPIQQREDKDLANDQNQNIENNEFQKSDFPREETTQDNNVVELQVVEENLHAGEKLDTADTIPDVVPSTAREYVEPGIYNMLNRQMNHHVYLFSLYYTLIPVIMWNIFRPCELVAFISDAYFVPYLRPEVPKFNQNQNEQADDCCHDEPCCQGPDPLCKDDDFTCLVLFVIWPLVILFAIPYLMFLGALESCQNCCKCEHEMVAFTSYENMYQHRTKDHKAKTDEEFLAEFIEDRKSPVGIARRHPERFIRGLFFSLGGFRSFHPSKICGPCCGSCRNCYKSFPDLGQEWQNEVQSRSMKKTKMFYEKYFHTSSYQELLELNVMEARVNATRIERVRNESIRASTAASGRLKTKAADVYSRLKLLRNNFRGAPQKEAMTRNDNDLV